MLQGELSAQLGYEKHEAKGRNSGNSRNGSRPKRLQTSAGETDDTSATRPTRASFVRHFWDEKRSNELERKITALYAKGTSTRDIQEVLEEIYGIEVSAAHHQRHHG